MRTFQNPSEAFAHRLRVVRTQQGLTAQQLVERLADQGFVMQRNAITKIETQNGRTTVTLDEVVAIAAALSTPVAVMLAPIDVPDAEVCLTPKMKQGAWRYMDHLTTGRWTGHVGWPAGERVAELYLELVDSQGDLRGCMDRVKEAEYVEDDRAARKARRDAVDAFRALQRITEELAGHGLADTEKLIPPDAMDLAKALGVTD